MAQPLRYLFFRSIIRFILNLYYRGIESYGTNFIPKRGRTLFVANHQAGLIDGILILGTTQQTIRLLIKHTLWENPIIGFFATGLGMIPVFRKQDLKPEDLANSTSAERNKKGFESVERTMLDSENCLIFPEGVSHDNPHMLKLKSGAARMLLQTEDAHDFRLGIQWLPVSIDLEKKDKPGARVVIHYHPPHQIASLKDLYEKDPEKAVEKLRSDMQGYMSEITLNFETWQDRVFLERLTEIWLSGAPNEMLLDRHNQLLKWKRIMENTYNLPEERRVWDILRAKVEALQTTLHVAGISADEVLNPSTEHRRENLVKLMPTLLALAPLLLFGVVFWWVPLWLIKFVTEKGARGVRDVIATYHLVASLVFIPAWLTIVFLASYFYINTWVVGLGAVILGIASGLSLLISSQRIRVEFKEAINMFRYTSLEALLATSKTEIQDIWALAARLWNRALMGQVHFDQHTPQARR